MNWHFPFVETYIQKVHGGMHQISRKRALMWLYVFSCEENIYFSSCQVPLFPSDKNTRLFTFSLQVNPSTCVRNVAKIKYAHVMILLGCCTLLQCQNKFLSNQLKMNVRSAAMHVLILNYSCSKSFEE